MPMPSSLQPLLQRLRVPVIAAPLFIISHPQLVIAQCTSGVIGSFPSLNARPVSVLDEWMAQITEALAKHDQHHPDRPAAPYAVNLIVHKSNQRLEQDLAICEQYRPPLVITSMGARPEVNAAVHAWGGIVLHDIINGVHARKAIEKGADGLIAVAAGAGGHAGAISPFALVQEIRAWFDGPLVLSGAIATGAAVLAAQAMGADLAYIGSLFIATEEANAAVEYQQMIVDSTSSDIVYSNLFTGVPANYLKPSIRAAGLDPDALPSRDQAPDFNSGQKAWRDIWGCGQGIGAISEITSVAERVKRLAREYAAARQRLNINLS